MEWYLLAMVLSLALPSYAETDCSSRCLTCAQRISEAAGDAPFNRLTCTLECEGILSSAAELDKCRKLLEDFSSLIDLKEVNEDSNGSENGDQQGAVAGSMAKRYGGFIKKIDKSKMFNSHPNENAHLKDILAKKYKSFLRKPRDRATPDVGWDKLQPAVGKVKRYGGFLRKLGRRRSGDREPLQKRPGGFGQSIRHKLNNQKRSGGFLRRPVKISAR